MDSPEARLTDVEYLEIQCKSALNSVKGMGFQWSLNPYIGCEHRCAFCYVRAYELRADRPFDDRYGRTVRVKVNVAGVLRSELSKRSWRQELVVIGAATDPYQPAEGKYRLTRQCLQALLAFSNPTGLITRGPMIVRDGPPQHFMSVLARQWPELVPRYERAYLDRQYLPSALSEAPMKEVARLRALHGVADRRTIRLEPPPPPKQLSLLG